MECSLQNDTKGQQGSTLHPSATPCDLSGRANWFPAAEVLWAPPEAAGSPISEKHGGWAWFDGETLNFLVYEALIFINCPILLDLIHGLEKYLSLKLPMPRSPSKQREAQGSHLWGKSWLSKCLERDNAIYIIVIIPVGPTMRLIRDWCLICHLILNASLYNGYHYPHYTDEEIEVWQKYTTCSMSYSQIVVVHNLYLGYLTPEPLLRHGHRFLDLGRALELPPPQAACVAGCLLLVA